MDVNDIILTAKLKYNKYYMYDKYFKYKCALSSNINKNR